jgi:hypothetical protein
MLIHQKINGGRKINVKETLIIPKRMKAMVVASYVCLDIHLHGTLHHTFAFRNIHLDIHRIIILITQPDASALKLRLRKKKKKKQFYASLCTKRREGVFHLQLKNAKFVHTEALYTLTER